MIINLLNRPIRIQSHQGGILKHQVLMPSLLKFTVELYNKDSTVAITTDEVIRVTTSEASSNLPAPRPGVFYLVTLDIQQSLKRPDLISVGRQLKSLVTSFIKNY